jgi:HK97 family phage prohead protease
MRAARNRGRRCREQRRPLFPGQREMTRKFLDIDDLRFALRQGRAAEPVSRITAGRPRAYDDGTRRIRYCFSDGSVDRMGDTINPNGWDISAFMRNPVALWAHDSSQPPIGRAMNVRVEGSRLMGDIQFAPAEVYPFADQIYKLAMAGYVGSVSVGFMPIDYKWASEPGREGGIDFLKQSLLEISVVPVPANVNALAERGIRSAQRRSILPAVGDAESARALLARARAEHAAAAEERMRERRAALLYANQFATLRW